MAKKEYSERNTVLSYCTQCGELFEQRLSNRGMETFCLPCRQEVVSDFGRGDYRSQEDDEGVGSYRPVGPWDF